MSIRRAAWSALLASALAALALGLGACGGSDEPSLDDPTAEATALLDRYFTALAEKDTAALDEILAPEFQVVRANGTVLDKTAYLADLPDVADFSFAGIQPTAGGDELVVSYQVTVTETLESAAQPTGPAPRLSVFEWQDGSWRLVAHANFGAIER